MNKFIKRGKFGFKNATNVGLLGSLTLPGPTGGAYNTDRICILEKVIKMLHGRFVHVGKISIDLQILRRIASKCVWHPGPAGEL